MNADMNWLLKNPAEPSLRAGNASLAQLQSCTIKPGTRRNTPTTTEVSSTTLPVAGIDLFATFLDCMLKRRTVLVA